MVDRSQIAQLDNTKFLKSTGILDAYEMLMHSVIMNGPPKEKTLYDHAAYELLKWESDNKATFRESQGNTVQEREGIIIKSTDNIPELNEYRKNEEGKISDPTTDFGGVTRIQISSKKNYNLTQNKLDLSIFQFKDRPMFRNNKGKFEPGRIEIQLTKPEKQNLQKVQDTTFTVDAKRFETLLEGKPVGAEQTKRTQGRGEQDESFQREDKSLSLSRIEDPVEPGNQSQIGTDRKEENIASKASSKSPSKVQSQVQSKVTSLKNSLMKDEEPSQKQDVSQYSAQPDKQEASGNNEQEPVDHEEVQDKSEESQS